jgi:hypothetical protein
MDQRFCCQVGGDQVFPRRRSSATPHKRKMKIIAEMAQKRWDTLSCFFCNTYYSLILNFHDTELHQQLFQLLHL